MPSDDLWRKDTRPRAEWEALISAGRCPECGGVEHCCGPSCRKRFFDWAFSLGYHDGANGLESHDYAFVSNMIDSDRYDNG